MSRCIKYCKCGCGTKLVHKPYHKYYGTPLYVRGHVPMTETGKKRMINSKIGKERSVETVLKIRNNHADVSGCNNPQWRGGLSGTQYGNGFTKSLKAQIRQRDRFTCQECQQTETQLGYPLSVHHIDYDKNNHHTDNLISLCRSCHSQTGFNRNDWTNYYVKKVRYVTI